MSPRLCALYAAIILYSSAASASCRPSDGQKFDPNLLRELAELRACVVDLEARLKESEAEKILMRNRMRGFDHEICDIKTKMAKADPKVIGIPVCNIILNRD